MSKNKELFLNNRSRIVSFCIDRFFVCLFGEYYSILPPLTSVSQKTKIIFDESCHRLSHHWNGSPSVTRNKPNQITLDGGVDSRRRDTIFNHESCIRLVPWGDPARRPPHRLPSCRHRLSAIGRKLRLQRRDDGSVRILVHIHFLRRLWVFCVFLRLSGVGALELDSILAIYETLL